MFHGCQLLSLTSHSSTSAPHLVKPMRKPAWSLLRCWQEVQATQRNITLDPPPNHQNTPKPFSFPTLSSHFRTCLRVTLLFLEILVIWVMKLFTFFWCVCDIVNVNNQTKFGGGKMCSVSVESPKQLEKRAAWVSRQWPPPRSVFLLFLWLANCWWECSLSCVAACW